MISKKLIGTKPVQANLRPDLKLKFCLSSMSMITFALLFYLTTSIYKIEQFLGRYGFLNCSEIWLFLMVHPHTILILDTDTASTLCISNHHLKTIALKNSAAGTIIRGTRVVQKNTGT